MATVFIIHGTYGSPEENWFPWLAKELSDQGHKVFVPAFPTPDNQDLDNWLAVMKNYELELGPDTILVGHSLGCAFILDLLETVKVRVRACFLVAGFVGRIGNPELDSINKTFTDKEFDWSGIRERCVEFFVYASDDDPFVPAQKAIELKNSLHADLTIVRKAGHFNSKSGYKKFSKLLKGLKPILDRTGL